MKMGNCGFEGLFRNSMVPLEMVLLSTAFSLAAFALVSHVRAAGTCHHIRDTG